MAVRHLLASGRQIDEIPQIADALVALHSSDPVTVYLSAAVRMRHPNLTAMEEALYTEHSVIRHHAMRRTLWVMTPEVLRLAHASATTALVRNEQRRIIGLIESSGIAPDGETWLRQARIDVLEALHRLGSATARVLGSHVPELVKPLHMAVDKSYAASPAAHTRVLLLLGFAGAIVRGRPAGTWVNGQYSWQPMDNLLPGGVGDLDPVVARAELVSRWLRTFGPGTAADIQWWLGGTGAQVKQALATVEAVSVDLEGSAAEGWLLPDDLAELDDPGPWVALLPGLDPTVMGWQQRSWFLGDHGPEAFDRNGNGGPTIWVDGQVVGAWVQRKDGAIVRRLWSDVPARRVAQIKKAADVVRELVGDKRFTVRFPSPASTALFTAD